MTIYKFFGQGTGGAEDAVASVDIQFDGVIEGMSLQTRSTSTMSGGDHVEAELSFLSTSNIGKHDARGSLLQADFGLHQTSSGATDKVGRSQMTGIAIPVHAGERVYMHVNGSTGETQDVTGYLYVADNAPVAPIRRR